MLSISGSKRIVSRNNLEEEEEHLEGLFDITKAYTRGVFWSKERMGNVVFPSSYLSSWRRKRVVRNR